jgi:hypothetical protein
MLYTIYRITIGDYHYIGSSKDFQQRKSTHKSNCNLNHKHRVYEVIRENGGWDKCTIVPIEQLDCEQRMTALIREEYWRRQYVNTLNMKQAYVSPEETKERSKLNNAKHNPINNPINNAKRDLSYIVCECGGEFQRHCKTVHLRGKRHMDFVQGASMAAPPPPTLDIVPL